MMDRAISHLPEFRTCLCLETCTFRQQNLISPPRESNHRLSLPLQSLHTVHRCCICTQEADTPQFSLHTTHPQSPANTRRKETSQRLPVAGNQCTSGIRNSLVHRSQESSERWLPLCVCFAPRPRCQAVRAITIRSSLPVDDADNSPPFLSSLSIVIVHR